jgi:hypothetical protein
MGNRNYQCQNQHCQKIRDGESIPVLHRTPVAIGGQIPASTQIRLHLLSLEEHDNLES